MNFAKDGFSFHFRFQVFNEIINSKLVQMLSALSPDAVPLFRVEHHVKALSGFNEFLNKLYRISRVNIIVDCTVH